MKSNVDVAAELTKLEQLDRAALADRWLAAFHCPAPDRCRAPLLRGALAWHLQMQAQQMGRFASLDRLLRQGKVSAVRSSLSSAGTRLVREWQGRTHQVAVLTDGFEYEGQRFRSLSAIARLITGTPWSGPLFFGLRS